MNTHSMVSDPSIVSNQSDVQGAGGSLLRDRALVLEGDEIADQEARVARRGEEGARRSCIADSKFWRGYRGGKPGGKPSEEEGGRSKGSEREVHSRWSGR